LKTQESPLESRNWEAVNPESPIESMNYEVFPEKKYRCRAESVIANVIAYPKEIPRPTEAAPFPKMP
jgi:hypothetical protein